MGLSNNDILKKLRVALQLRDDQIVEILELVDFRISKGELGNFFRNEDHPKYMDCGDQVLRNFLNGLVIHLRGTKEEPKNAMDVINANAKQLLTKAPSKGTSPTRLAPWTGGTAHSIEELGIPYNLSFANNTVNYTSQQYNIFAQLKYKISDAWTSQTIVSRTRSSSDGYVVALTVLSNETLRQQVTNQDIHITEQIFSKILMVILKSF